MNDLMKTEFFILINKNSLEITNKEMKNAYEDFVAQVEAINQSDKDYSIAYRALNLTRIELQSLQTQILYEQGGKCA